MQKAISMRASARDDGPLGCAGPFLHRDACLKVQHTNAAIRAHPFLG